MQVRDARSFTATARRAQIVAAAIEVIADLGYGQASFARIAERAGLSSTRLISYHFAGKDELIRQVTAEVIGSIGAHMTERMADAGTPRQQLHTYLRALVEYIGDHRDRMRALTEIVLGGGLSYDAADAATATSALVDLLRAGQRAGQFRDFDVRVMATTVQRSVEGLPFLLATEPDIDTAAYAEELVTLFDLATRR